MNREKAQRFLAELPGVRNDLPFSPVLLQKLFMQTGESSVASMQQIAETISRDQGLTAKLLAVANSAFYGLQAQVTTVQRAATVLGLREIRNIVLAIGIRALGGRRPVPREFDLAAYWRHQFFVALASKTLAGDCGLDPDQLFTAGLLHDLGKLIVAMYRPEDWKEIHQLAAVRSLPDAVAEDLYWGLEHGVIGGLVLGSWDLPPEIAEPVNWHHAPALAPFFGREASVIGLADALVHSGGDLDGPWAGTVQPLSLALSLDPGGLREQAVRTLADETVDQFVSNLL